MARLKQTYPQNGFFGIGILNNKAHENIGSLWRSAYVLGASFIFTVGQKYNRQSSDVVNAWQKIPMYHYLGMADFVQHLPYDTRIVGVELDPSAQHIVNYCHPNRCVYLLGNEQSGLPKEALKICHELIQLPGDYSLNVAVAGSIVLYDRVSKR